MSDAGAPTSARRTLRLLAAHPSLQALALFLVSLPVLVPIGALRLLLAAALLEVFLVGSPLLGLRHPHFWRYQGASLVAQLLLFLGWGALCEALAPGGNAGDDMMIFLGPVMTPMVILPLVVVLHLVLRVARRGQAAAAASPHSAR